MNAAESKLLKMLREHAHEATPEHPEWWTVDLAKSLTESEKDALVSLEALGYWDADALRVLIQTDAGARWYLERADNSGGYNYYEFFPTQAAALARREELEDDGYPCERVDALPLSPVT